MVVKIWLIYHTPFQELSQHRYRAMPRLHPRTEFVYHLLHTHRRRPVLRRRHVAGGRPMSAAKKGSRTKKVPDFHTTMQSIEALVEKLEDEETPLEEALETFEKGVLLIRQAREQSTQAEQKVMLLMEEIGEPRVSYFQEEDDGEYQEGIPF